MVTDTPEIPQTTHAEPRPSDTLSTNRVDLYMLSPSARTSFTRVDTMVNAEDDDEDAQAETEDPADPAEESDEAVNDQASPPEVPQTPQVSLTFLLVSGKRRSMTFDPETTVGRTKELVWNAWPKDWQDERPPAPSYLRILYLGKILQDEDTLIKVGFPTNIPPPAGQAERSSTPPLSTVVHLSIRSSPPPGTKDTPKKRGIRRNSGTDDMEQAQGLGCCASCIIC